MRRKSIFEASDSIFQDRDLDSENPLISLEEQTAMNPTVETAGAKTLMAVFQEDGYPLVAMAAVEAGELTPTEGFRAPSPDEYSLIKQKGKLIKGGVTQVPIGPAVPVKSLGESKSIEILGSRLVYWPPFGLFAGYSKPVQAALWVGIVGTIGGGYWWWWKKKGQKR